MSTVYIGNLHIDATGKINRISARKILLLLARIHIVAIMHQFFAFFSTTLDF